MSSFWNKIEKPIFAMAPLANVTDVVFREIIARHGKPDVFFTEFVSTDGLCSKGREVLLRDLKYTESQRPIVAQFFGAKPENFYKCAILANELGFDGIDINMGCPDRAVEKQGAGAALIKNHKLAAEIIKATKDGAAKLPVSVKTRIGYNEISIKEWLPVLLGSGLAVVILHLRTRKEMSDVPAHWEVLKEAIEIRAKTQGTYPTTLLLGNGDAMNLKDGEQKIKKVGADGVMFGRAIFGNPFLFSRVSEIRENKNASIEVLERGVTTREKLEIMLEHLELYEKTWGNAKNFDNMKKHFKAYVSDFRGSAELRAELMKTKNGQEAKAIINNSKIDGY